MELGPLVDSLSVDIWPTMARGSQRSLVCVNRVDERDSGAEPREGTIKVNLLAHVREDWRCQAAGCPSRKTWSMRRR
uniref:hypothetical protein n=1 Tax=Ensifer adhaerens TaxID=106592 RepID=UPI000DE48B91